MIPIMRPPFPGTDLRGKGDSLRFAAPQPTDCAVFWPFSMLRPNLWAESFNKTHIIERILLDYCDFHISLEDRVCDAAFLPHCMDDSKRGI
ncbi:hypothetical protein OE647_10020 [Defluviimonas sp. WL0075]|uniref:Uncharacterized protein n=1 Tax=Albidovulum sediminicola TaxID=2984331 RepID=A0ABT2Z1U3_9RHOB|nr:hypothetical protein [Defluviimonas sp. WL0075]